MTSNPSPVYNGRYELRSQVARGGTAQVYLARDLLLDRPVALKVLFPELSADHAFVERFRREAQAAANLSHPNIVPVFDWGESDRTHFIVMEYVDGEPLSAIIRAESPLVPARAASIAADIGKALSYAHRHGVVHRDVKPGNVLITSDGLVKVTDFGIARAMGVDEQVTQTGLVMGTATYFSPEQAQGLGVDGRSDVYALGVVLYEMLAGRPPFVGESPVSIAYQHVREEAPPLRSLNPSVPAELEAVVEKAMAKAPADRYSSADDLRVDLERFMRGQTVLARAAVIGGTGPVTTVLPAGGTAAVDLLDTSVVEPVAPERPGKVRTTTPWWVLAAVVLLAGIGLVVYFGGRALGYFGGAHFVQVPDLKGLAVQKAEAELKAKGLEWKLTHTPGTKAQANHVARQSVPYPQSARVGDTIRLTIWRYTPPAMATVPDVSSAGLSFSSASAQLKQVGFTASPTYVSATSSGQTAGMVIGQSPSAGTRARRHSTVTVDVVKKGTTYVTIPSGIVGETTSAATSALQGLGLKVSSKYTYRLNGQYPAGEVITTSPSSPGQTVPPGSTVVLIVSKGGVVIQSVAGLTVSSAEQVLAAQGFSSFATRTVSNSKFPAGAVEKTFPAAGATVETNRTIVLFVVGSSGTSGTSGTSGASGASGTSGTTATSGPSPSGTSGPLGLSGTSGLPGTSGKKPGG